MRYGLPYKGSKSQIAESILSYLPEGKRLVDLFGGGGAISHAASFSYKWDFVLYNELSPLVCRAFSMAIHGEFSTENRWISREDFFRLKDTDPYVAFCFSFSNDLKTYAYGKEVEPWKKALHYARVYEDNSLLKAMGIDSDGSREDLKRFFKDSYKGELESLERLPIEITNSSYTDYTYLPGDIVYCDPPYENTDCGSYKGFDSNAFYEWVRTRPFTVYFSSYTAPSDFYLCWEQDKRVLSASGASLSAREKIFSNTPPEKTSLIPVQLTFF